MVMSLISLGGHRLLLKLVRNVGKRLGGVTMNRILRVDLQGRPLAEALLACLLVDLNAWVRLVH